MHVEKKHLNIKEPNSQVVSDISPIDFPFICTDLSKYLLSLFTLTVPLIAS